MNNQNELQRGTDVEMEHTKDPALAQKIATDHIKEDPNYYSKLVAAGLEETDECAAVVSVSAKSAPKQGGQRSLTSSGLGKDGAAKPLTSTNLTAPEKNIKKGNTIANKKTPSLDAGSDQVGHFCKQIGDVLSTSVQTEANNWPYDEHGKLLPMPPAKGDHKYSDKKFADMGGVDNPSGDFGDHDDIPAWKSGGAKDKPTKLDPDDPDIDRPDVKYRQ
jgi:hypothetical protein